MKTNLKYESPYLGMERVFRAVRPDPLKTGHQKGNNISSFIRAKVHKEKTRRK